jgi:long-subunit acyl-CoA synthetase (AMP-forming)
MGYYADGNPSRGELLVSKQYGMTRGYYNNKAKTDEAFFEENGIRYVMYWKR